MGTSDTLRITTDTDLVVILCPSKLMTLLKSGQLTLQWCLAVKGFHCILIVLLFYAICSMFLKVINEQMKMDTSTDAGLQNEVS